MGARTGRQFLEGLRQTARQVWVDGEAVTDVTSHPALAGAAQSLASIFDRQHAYAEDCLVADPETGEPINISHSFPRSVAGLIHRNRGLSRISEATVGLMGRTPDYMNMKFSAFAARPTSGPVETAPTPGVPRPSSPSRNASPAKISPSLIRSSSPRSTRQPIQTSSAIR